VKFCFLIFRVIFYIQKIIDSIDCESPYLLCIAYYFFVEKFEPVTYSNFEQN